MEVRYLVHKVIMDTSLGEAALFRTNSPVSGLGDLVLDTMGFDISCMIDLPIRLFDSALSQAKQST